MRPSPWKSLIHMYNKTVFSHLRKTGNMTVLNHVWQMPAFSGTVFFSWLNPTLLVCQTYVTPYLMKSWSVSFGDFHPSGRIGKQL